MHEVPRLIATCERKLIEKFLADLRINIHKPRYIFELLRFTDIYDLQRLKEVVLEFVCNSKQSMSTWPRNDIEELLSQSPEVGADILWALLRKPKFMSFREVTATEEEYLDGEGL